MSPGPSFRGLENEEEPTRENGREKPMRLEGKIRARCPGNQWSHLETMAVGWESSKLIILEKLGVEEQGMENETRVHISLQNGRIVFLFICS